MYNSSMTTPRDPIDTTKDYEIARLKSYATSLRTTEIKKDVKIFHKQWKLMFEKYWVVSLIAPQKKELVFLVVACTLNWRFSTANFCLDNFTWHFKDLEKSTN